MIRLLFSFLMVLLTFPSNGRDLVYIQKEDNSKALLVLPGLGSRGAYRKAILETFRSSEYDVYVLDNKSRKSVEGCQDNIVEAYIKYNMKRYKEVNVFSYILGTWCFNAIMNSRDAFPNIKRVVHDRGPIQERVASTMIESHPWLFKRVVGKVLEDFSKTPYPVLKDTSLQLGILIETEPSKLARHFREEINSGDSIYFRTDSLQQSSATEYRHIPFDHDTVYTRIGELSGTILHYFKHGAFSKEEMQVDIDVTKGYKIN